MKLEKWALIAEIIGAAAIVISLVYLIIEVRENTDAVNASNRQSTAARAQELALASATDPFLRRIQVYPNVELTDLAPEDAVGLNAFIAAHLETQSKHIGSIAMGGLTNPTCSLEGRLLCSY